MLVRPMKAPSDSVKLEDVRFPVAASAKIDGFRASHQEGGLRSKTLNDFANGYVNRWFRELPQLDKLDGELVVGKPFGEDTIRRTTSGINKMSGTPDFHWHVFDDFSDPTLPFAVRFRMVRRRISGLDLGVRARVHVLPHLIVKNAGDLLLYEEKVLSQGYEGLMLRDPNAPHKAGTSTAREGFMFKFKRFVDAEAIVLELREGSVNTNAATRDADGATKRSTNRAGMVASGLVGVLVCRDVETGRVIEVGAGRLTKEERAAYMEHPEQAVGQMITYRYFPTGTKNAPRFPTFQTFRRPEHR